MKLNTPFEHVLEQLPTDQLKKLMLWYASGPESVETHSQTLNAILNEVQTLDAETCYQTLDSLSIEDVVASSLMNEFGPSFADRPCFDLLTQAISQNIQQTPEKPPEKASREAKAPSLKSLKEFRAQSVLN